MPDPLNTAFRAAAAGLLCAVIVLPAYAQASDKGESPELRQPAVQTKNAAAELQADLNALLDEPAFRNAAIGAGVYSLQKRSYLYQRNSDALLLPASCTKLLTTAAALDYLGKDFRYTTSVFLDGIIKRNGEFVGNIIIRGAGDPTMSDYFYDNPLGILEDWVDTFELLGIKSIRGNLVGDDSYFDAIPWGPGWAWDDTPYSYSAQVSALSFYDNKVDIAISPGDTVGAAARISLSPPVPSVKIRNYISTYPPDSASDVIPVRQALSNVIELHGGISYGSKTGTEPFVMSVAIDNPTIFMMELLQQALQRRGIVFRGRIFDSEEWGDQIFYQDLQAIFDHTSPPLEEILPVINARSHNLCAELLLKTMGKESAGSGSFEKGVERVQHFLQGLGIAAEDVRLVDGSGLSRQNLLSARQLITLLDTMHRSPQAAVYRASLAMPGKEGTLKRRMTETRAEDAVFAKTGSMNNTSALSGYVISRDNEAFAFALILNNTNVPQSVARNLQDLFCMRLAGFSNREKQQKN